MVMPVILPDSPRKLWTNPGEQAGATVLGAVQGATPLPWLGCGEDLLGNRTVPKKTADACAAGTYSELP